MSTPGGYYEYTEGYQCGGYHKCTRGAQYTGGYHSLHTGISKYTMCAQYTGGYHPLHTGGVQYTADYREYTGLGDAMMHVGSYHEYTRGLP